MFPWSVIPTAGWPSAAAVATTSAIRAAPSSIENSVCRCRCTNELRQGADNPLFPTWPLSATSHRGVDDPVENHIGVTLTIEGASPPGKPRGQELRPARDPPGGARSISSGVSEPCMPSSLVSWGSVGVDERHRLAGSEHDVAHPAADRPLGRGPEPPLVEQLLAGEHPRPVADARDAPRGELAGRARLGVEVPEARRRPHTGRSSAPASDRSTHPPRLDVDLPVVRGDRAAPCDSGQRVEQLADEPVGGAQLGDVERVVEAELVRDGVDARVVARTRTAPRRRRDGGSARRASTPRSSRRSARRAAAASVKPGVRNSLRVTTGTAGPGTPCGAERRTGRERGDCPSSASAGR